MLLEPTRDFDRNTDRVTSRFASGTYKTDAALLAV